MLKRVSGDRRNDAVGSSLSTWRRCMARRRAERAGVTPRIARPILAGVSGVALCAVVSPRATRGESAGHAMIDAKSNSENRALMRLIAGAMIAAGIATWPAPGDARSRVFGHNLHPVRHGLHLHSLRHSSYPCSVFGHRPCVPYGNFCSVFSHHPCLPDIDYPIGQDLQLTIASRAEGDATNASAEKNIAGHLPHDLNTIRDVFSALRACWVPPAKDVARSDKRPINLRLWRGDGCIDNM